MSSRYLLARVPPALPCRAHHQAIVPVGLTGDQHSLLPCGVGDRLHSPAAAPLIDGLGATRASMPNAELLATQERTLRRRPTSRFRDTSRRTTNQNQEQHSHPFSFAPPQDEPKE